MGNDSLAQESKIEKQQFRRVCSRFACGITIVTVRDEKGALHGMTASAFTSVSLVPPLVLFCIDHRAGTLEHFRRSVHFGINILSKNQQSLSERFAGSGYDRFDGVQWYPGQTGVPLLPDVLATIECSRVNLVSAGDHDILIGEVLYADCQDVEPLIHFGSQYRHLAEFSPEFRPGR